MREDHGLDVPPSRWWATLTASVAVTLTGACTLDNIPDELRPTIEPRIHLAISLAKTAATRCADVKKAATPPPTTSPAEHTALAADLAVTEILVRCRWVDQDDPSPQPVERTFDFPPLHGVPRRTLAAPPVLVYDSCVKPGDPDFERIHVPSSYSDIVDSADIVATEPIRDGGTVEVTVAVKR